MVVLLVDLLLEPILATARMLVLVSLLVSVLAPVPVLSRVRLCVLVQLLSPVLRPKSMRALSLPRALLLVLFLATARVRGQVLMRALLLMLLVLVLPA